MDRQKYLKQTFLVIATSLVIVGCSPAPPIMPSPSPTNTYIQPAASSTFTPSPTFTPTPSITPTLTAQELYDRQIAIGQYEIDSAVNASKQNDMAAVRTALANAGQAFRDALEIVPDSPDIKNWLSWIETDFTDKYVYVLRIGDTCQVEISKDIEDTSNTDPVNLLAWELKNDSSIEVSDEEQGTLYSIEERNEEEDTVTIRRIIVYPFDFKIPSTLAPGIYELVFDTKAYCRCCEMERKCQGEEVCRSMYLESHGIQCLSSYVLVAQHKFTVLVVVFPRK